MRRIKLTEEQLKMVHEYDQKKKIKLTESQFNKLFDVDSDKAKESFKENFGTYDMGLTLEGTEAQITLGNFANNLKTVFKGLIRGDKSELIDFGKSLNIKPDNLLDAMISIGIGKLDKVNDVDVIKVGKENIKEKIKHLYDYLFPIDEMISLGDDIEMLDEDGGLNNIVGLDILKHPPVSNLRGRRSEEPTEVTKVSFPGIDRLDSSRVIDAKTELTGFKNDHLKIDNKWIPGYIDNFKKMFGEEPVFTLNPDNRNLDVDIVNPKYIEVRDEFIRSMSAAADEDPTIVGEDEIEEATTASSAGAYVGPAFLAKDKKNHRFGRKPIYTAGTIVGENTENVEKIDPSKDMPDMIKDKIKDYLENHPRPSAYVKRKVELGDYKEAWLALRNLSENNLTNTSYSGGKFVEFDDCVRYNNNKEAQNGGCSQGAVDNVVKLKDSL